MSSVSVSELIDKLKLVNLTPDINVEDIKINQPDINRPALQLAGFLEHFETGRVQIIGFVEYTYMNYHPICIRWKSFAAHGRPAGMLTVHVIKVYQFSHISLPLK